MHIIAVIPTHNRKEYLKNLLNSLANQNISAKLSKVVVVDGSTDGTIEMLKESYPDVIIVKGDGSWWYTKSMNEGFKKALEYSPDFILTLNDDIELDKNHIHNMLKAHKKVPNGSILGSISFLNGNRNLLYSCGSRYKNKWFNSIERYMPLFTEIEPKSLEGIIKPSVILPGRGMFIPKDTLKKLGGFDNKFKQYHSDGDFCLRAHKKNFGVYVVWDAIIYVNMEKTSSSSSFIKTSFVAFVKSFFYDKSRLYLPSKSRFIWRHNKKAFWPVKMLIYILAAFKNYFLNTKINE
jgi:GT2 family glycosyltransferase